MQSKFATLLFVCVFPLFLSAQVADSILADQETLMAGWADSVMKDTLKERRIRSNGQLVDKMEEVLSLEGSFEYVFDSLPSISFQYPEDSTFRVVTWQLYIDMDEYQYFGFIQTNDSTPKLFKLNDKSEEIRDLAYDVLTPDNWYGVIYYKIKSFDTAQGTKHLLFGLDSYRLYKKRKLVEILSFENGQPSFGSALFSPADISRTDLYKNRLMMEYSAEASTTFNYNEKLDMIVKDHLIPLRTSAQIKGESYVPDGSYEGYKLEGELWVYQEKIYTQVSETAPRPTPILDKRKDKDRKFGKSEDFKRRKD